MIHLGKENPYLGREEDLQRACIRYLRLHPAKPLAFHVPNGGKRTATEAKIFQGLGVMPGVADLIILKPAAGHCGLFVELKAKGGKLTAHQETFLTAAGNQGYLTAIVWNFEAFKTLIDNYLKNSI